MHLLLLRPPPRHGGSRGLLVPPLGLAYLASSVQAEGLEVSLWDAWAEGWTWDQMEENVRRLRPDVLGLSAMTPVADVALAAARQLRPHVQHIILGGPHPTALGAALLEQAPELDSLAVGEGEISLPLWLRALARGETQHPISGIITRDWDGGAAPQPDLGTLPPPARDLLPNARYRYPLATRGPMTTMVTSRGCPFHCTFCDQSVTGRRFRARPPEAVVDEMAALEDQGFGYVCLYDDVFTLDRRRAIAICDGIRRRGLTIEWKCEARVDCVDETLLGEMASAGCRTIAFGLETANAHGLQALGKDTTVEQAATAIRIAKRQGLEVLAYVLFGIPGETPEDALRTLAFCEEMGVDVVQFATLAPTPGTPLWDQAQREGWATANVRGPFDDDLDRPALLPPGWTEDDLRALMRHALKRHYLKPRMVARQLVRAARSGAMGHHLMDSARHARSTLKALWG